VIFATMHRRLFLNAAYSDGPVSVRSRSDFAVGVDWQAELRRILPLESRLASFTAIFVIGLGATLAWAIFLATSYDQSRSVPLWIVSAALGSAISAVAQHVRLSDGLGSPKFCLVGMMFAGVYVLGGWLTSYLPFQRPFSFTNYFYDDHTIAI